MNDQTKQYSCSVWSKRFATSQEVLNFHYTFTEKENHRSNKIPCELNITYGRGEREKIDIYGTDLPKEAPILAFIHGGYWQEKGIGRHTYAFIANTLYTHRIKTIFVGYELCPDVTLAEIVQNIEIAARKCIQYAQDNKSKGLYFAGHSAGAHLAASLLFTSQLFSRIDCEDIVKGLILLSGVYDLAPIVQNADINEPLKLDEQLASKLSPIKTISTALCNQQKFAIFVGEHESPEFIKQSREFHAKLINTGHKSHLSVVSNVDHFNIVELLSRDQFEVTRTMISLIKE